jgi:lipopolysaccharide/colanic/teichoic acid biosynthesis glycosyltransferase
MVASAHAQQRELYAQNQVDGPQFKMDRDPRITPLGRVLRATNIDELPQLINVLRGEMSLIGPRPSPFRENQICVPWRRARLSVRPGITGLWQVCRHDRDVGDFHQWIYFDTLYVRHMSFWLDLRILLATFLTAGGRVGMPVTWLIARRRLQSASQPSYWGDHVPPADSEEQEPVRPPQAAALTS